LNAARANKEKVNMSDFEFAKDKILMGSERKTMVISDEEKRNTSYHETGHVLVARMLPGTDPIHKVTIIPRGRALGLTQQLPIDEKHTYPREYLEKNISILLGGRAAEEIVLHDFTTGAGNDIERATNLARKMICEWGMSDKMGPLSYGKKKNKSFWEGNLLPIKTTAKKRQKISMRKLYPLLLATMKEQKRFLPIMLKYCIK